MDENLSYHWKELLEKSNGMESDVIRALLNKAQKLKRDGVVPYVFATEICGILYKSLENCSDNVEMNATCYYAYLSLLENKEECLSQISDCLADFHDRILDMNLSEIDSCKGISLIYGLFQSSILPTISEKEICMMFNLLIKSIDILVLLSYTYSKYTFLTFKTLQYIDKLLKYKSFSEVLNEDNLVQLITITSLNWENPINGVRGFNKIIFGKLIKILQINKLNYIVDGIYKELNYYPWNKAKYLMLCEIVILFPTIRKAVEVFPDLINGLYCSLCTNGLVSAGTDLYSVILNKIKNLDDWDELFYENVMKFSSLLYLKNISNYWMLNTLKKLPGWGDYIMNKRPLENLSEYELYFYLNVIKHSCKLGDLQEDTKTCCLNIIHNSLNHVNVEIRSTAFAIICINFKKTISSEDGLQNFNDYIENNMNSDSTVLRISMLNSVTFFFDQIHSVMFEKNQKNQPFEKEMAPKICSTFQTVLRKSLLFNGNYQRKIATLNLINIYIASSKRSSFLEDMNMLQNDDKVFDILMVLLQDPSDDIRDSTFKLILNHFNNKLLYENCKLVTQLKEAAKNKIRSSLFFEVSSGHCMFRLLSAFMISHQTSGEGFNTIEELFDWCTTDLQQQFQAHKLRNDFDENNDLLDSIRNGNTLHNVINVIYIILDTAKERNYSLNEILTNDRKNKLVNLLDDIVNLHTGSMSKKSSADFNELNKMLDNIVAKSSLNKLDENSAKISDLHQLVLNCIWLTLKACCDLSSMMLKYISDDETEIARRCLDIIRHVLVMTRHKGAMESAGVAIGKSVRELTSRKTKSSLCRIPLEMIKKVICDVVNKDEMICSVTRRGAGLSIMIHRIVANDMLKGKPIFHYTMKSLLKSIETDCKPVQQQKDANHYDIPKAIQIHLLTKIVADSSLATETTYYSADIAQVAFGNIASDQWQIRNAALQLYGSLLPKLIGQKKSLDGEISATVSIDEFKTHAPKLWLYILEQLRNQKDQKDSLQAHSNLLPILNLLASLAERYRFQFLTEQEIEEENLLKHLITLLSSSIYTVRRLTAESIANIFTFEKIFNEIINCEALNENLLHGYLLLVKTFKRKSCSHEKHLKSWFADKLSKTNNSLIITNLYDEIFNCSQQSSDYLTTFNRMAPQVCEHYIRNYRFSELLSLVKHIETHPDVEDCLDYLHDKLETDFKHINYDNEVSIQIFNTLLYYHKRFELSNVWRVLLLIYEKVNISINEDLYSDLHRFLNNLAVVNYKHRWLVIFLLKITPVSNVEFYQNYSNWILEKSQPEQNDIDWRMISVTALLSVGSKLKELDFICKKNILKSIVLLLQDECEEIRNEATKFFTDECKNKHPFYCLKHLLNHKTLKIYFNDTNLVLIFCEELEIFLPKSAQKTEDLTNPFANEESNIYFEKEPLLEILSEVRILC